MGYVPKFVLLPEAPVFRPSEEEFKDPYTYLNSIREIGQRAGICRIIPPPNWKPPFSLDINKFSFTTRLQELNEMEAHCRLRSRFYETIAQFHAHQGTPMLRTFYVNKKPLDLYVLHMYVQEEGGFDRVQTGKRWAAIGRRIGLDVVKCTSMSNQLHLAYRKHLLPYDQFLANAELAGKTLKNSGGMRRPKKITDIGHAPHKGSIPTTPSTNGTRREIDGLGLRPALSNEDQHITDKRKAKKKELERMGWKKGDYCEICLKETDDEAILLCDGCDRGYHKYCLVPALDAIPACKWLCPDCLLEECDRPIAEHGFGEGATYNNVAEFSLINDKFIKDTFGTLTPTTKEVEAKFWATVQNPNNNISVEYGADLHSKEMGSGFPHIRHGTDSMGPTYAQDPWNLNNIPVIPKSALHLFGGSITGMTVPWLYVGMCMSTFCWHTEDHYTYSINYNHWGAPKTWYGVPGAQAEAFEAVMKEEVPLLFEQQPGVLHSLATLMSPKYFIDRGVNVVRTDQYAGEFVITFPRAYHGGFNQGLNFAEAVNFASADWLAWGQQSIKDYASVGRYPVFSHEELLCGLAANASTLDQALAYHASVSLAECVDQAMSLRAELMNTLGPIRCEVFKFENYSDDERKCAKCNTTCYLSALTCTCQGVKEIPNMVCLRHMFDLCPCVAKAVVKVKAEDEVKLNEKSDVPIEGQGNGSRCTLVLYERFAPTELKAMVEVLRVRAGNIGLVKRERTDDGVGLEAVDLSDIRAGKRPSEEPIMSLGCTKHLCCDSDTSIAGTTVS